MNDTTAIHILPGLSSSRTIVLPECLFLLSIGILIVASFYLFNQIAVILSDCLISWLEGTVSVDKEDRERRPLQKERKAKPVVSLPTKKSVSPKSRKAVLLVEASQRLASLQSYSEEAAQSLSNKKEWYQDYTTTEKQIEELRGDFMAHMKKLTSNDNLTEDYFLQFSRMLEDSRPDVIALQKFMLAIVEANMNLCNELTAHNTLLQKLATSPTKSTSTLNSSEIYELYKKLSVNKQEEDSL